MFVKRDGETEPPETWGSVLDGVKKTDRHN